MTHAPFHLAQLNIARAKAPLTDPLLAGFVARLEEINALADAAEGFVWRFQTPEGNAVYVRPYDDDRIIVNLSVWRDLEALKAYAFRGGHAEMLRARRQWFETMSDAFSALWWVPAGTLPTIEDAKERLDHLRAHGPTPRAFTFQKVFAPG